MDYVDLRQGNQNPAKSNTSDEFAVEGKENIQLQEEFVNKAGVMSVIPPKTQLDKVLSSAVNEVQLLATPTGGRGRRDDISLNTEDALLADLDREISDEPDRDPQHRASTLLFEQFEADVEREMMEGISEHAEDGLTDVLPNDNQSMTSCEQLEGATVNYSNSDAPTDSLPLRGTGPVEATEQEKTVDIVEPADLALKGTGDADISSSEELPLRGTGTVESGPSDLSSSGTGAIVTSELPLPGTGDMDSVQPGELPLRRTGTVESGPSELSSSGTGAMVTSELPLPGTGDMDSVQPGELPLRRTGTVEPTPSDLHLRGTDPGSSRELPLKGTGTLEPAPETHPATEIDAVIMGPTSTPPCGNDLQLKGTDTMGTVAGGEAPSVATGGNAVKRRGTITLERHTPGESQEELGAQQRDSEEFISPARQQPPEAPLPARGTATMATPRDGVILQARVIDYDTVSDTLPDSTAGMLPPSVSEGEGPLSLNSLKSTSEIVPAAARNHHEDSTAADMQTGDMEDFVAEESVSELDKAFDLEDRPNSALSDEFEDAQENMTGDQLAVEMDDDGVPMVRSGSYTVLAADKRSPELPEIKFERASDAIPFGGKSMDADESSVPIGRTPPNHTPTINSALLPHINGGAVPDHTDQIAQLKLELEKAKECEPAQHLGRRTFNARDVEPVISGNETARVTDLVSKNSQLQNELAEARRQLTSTQAALKLSEDAAKTAAQAAAENPSGADSYDVSQLLAVLTQAEARIEEAYLDSEKYKENVRGLETSFLDVIRRYENLKKAFNDSQQNEKRHAAHVQQLKDKFDKAEKKYMILKDSALKEIEAAEQKVADAKASGHSEVFKWQAMYKRAEQRVTTLERELEGKIADVKELNKLTDSLLQTINSPKE